MDDVMTVLLQQLSQDREALRARGLMIEILGETVTRLRGAGFAPALELADGEALVVLRLDVSAWAVQQVSLPARVLEREPVPGPQSVVGGVAPEAITPPSRVAVVPDVVPPLQAGGGDMPAPSPADPVAPVEARAPAVWTPERDAELIRLKQDGLDMESVAARLGVTRRAVENRACRLRKAGHSVPAVPPQDPKVWTEARDAQLLELLREGLPGVEVAARMGITASSVHDRRRRLRAAGVDVPALPKGVGIERAIEARRVWTPELDARLIEMYRRGKSDADIAAGLGGTFTAGAVSVRVGILRKAGRIEVLSRRAVRAAKDAAASVKAVAKRAVRAPASAIVEQKSEPVSQPIPEDKVALSDAIRAGAVAVPDVKAVSAPAPAAVAPAPAPAAKVVVEKPAAMGKSSDAARFVPKAGGGMVPAAARPVQIQRPPEAAPPVVQQSSTGGILARHLDALPAAKGFDAELDLELCEAVFGGTGGLQMFATDMGFDLRAVQARFEAIVAPFRRDGVKGLPIETAGLLLPALRARVAQARGAA